MATRIAWWLNLDAGLELEAPEGYVRSDKLAGQMAGLATQMTSLLRDVDLLLTGDPVATRDALALAFCPTPSALAALTQLGFTAPAAPSLAVLRAVSCRSFATRLGQTLPHAAYVSSEEHLLEQLAQPCPTSEWLLKRDFAFAGRERRRVRGADLDVPTLGFVRRSFARGQGLQVEPLLARESDFAQHGYLLASGRLMVGPLMAQRCDERGVWKGSRIALDHELGLADREALAACVSDAGRALYAAGYFGPFGVDAFVYRTSGGDLAFQPRSEVNARFSMGYPRELLENALVSQV